MGTVKRIIDKYLYRKITCLVIQLDNSAVEDYAFEAHTFSLNNGSLELVASEKGKHLKGFDDLDLAQDHPWVIAVQGRGVVYQLGPSTDSFPTALNARLPAVKAADFTGQRSIGEPALYSFARTETIEKILTYLNGILKLNIQGVTFGLSALPTSFPLLPLSNVGGSITIGGQEIRYEDGRLIEIRSSANSVTDESYLIDDKTYSGNQLIALASVLPVFSNQNLANWNLSAFTETAVQAYRTKWLAKVVGAAGLALLLMMAAINSIAYTSLHRKQETLGYQQQRFSTQLIHLDSLSTRLENRRKLLGADAGGNRTFSSFYADRIAASLPAEIQLAEVQVFPLIKGDRSARRTDPPQFNRKLIVIRGRCNEGGPISTWIARLNTQSWVENALLENNQLPDFTVKVFVSEDI